MNPSVKGEKLEAGEITFSEVLAAEHGDVHLTPKAHVEKPGAITVGIPMLGGGSKWLSMSYWSFSLRIGKSQAPMRDHVSSKADSPTSKQNRHK